MPGERPAERKLGVDDTAAPRTLPRHLDRQSQGAVVIEIGVEEGAVSGFARGLAGSASGLVHVATMQADTRS